GEQILLETESVRDVQFPEILGVTQPSYYACHFGPELYTLIIERTSARASSSFETTEGQSNPRCFFCALDKFVKLFFDFAYCRFCGIKLTHVGRSSSQM